MFLYPQTKQCVVIMISLQKVASCCDANLLHHDLESIIVAIVVIAATNLCEETGVIAHVIMILWFRCKS